MLSFELALLNVPGEFEYVTDNKPLFEGWRRRRFFHCDGVNSDLWFRIRVALKGREEGIVLKWTPSHVDPSDPSLSEDL